MAGVWLGCAAPAFAEDKSILMNGVLEIEAASGDDFTGADNSDAVLATVEIGIDVQITEGVDGHILLLYEEDETPLEMDEGTITLSNLGGSSLYFTGGQMYVPFGNFASNMISDPLTLELAETRESALQIGFESGNFYGSVYMFNGATMRAGDDNTLSQTGINLGFAQENENVSYDAGLSFINSISDSDTLQDAVTDPIALADTVGGMGVHAIVSYGAFTFIAEHVAATDAFATADLAFNGQDAEPSTYNVEVGYGFELGAKEATIAVALQGTEDALALGLPKTSTLIGLSMGIRENTTIALELRNDEDYDTSDGGTGESASTLTGQLAVEF